MLSTCTYLYTMHINVCLYKCYVHHLGVHNIVYICLIALFIIIIIIKIIILIVVVHYYTTTIISIFTIIIITIISIIVVIIIIIIYIIVCFVLCTQPWLYKCILFRMYVVIVRVCRLFVCVQYSKM